MLTFGTHAHGDVSRDGKNDELEVGLGHGAGDGCTDGGGGCAILSRVAAVLGDEGLERRQVECAEGINSDGSGFAPLDEINEGTQVLVLRQT